MSFCMHFSVHSDISFQILKAGGMSGLEDELMQHVMDVVLTTASQLQRWSGVVEPMEAKIEDDPCSTFAEELLKCSQHLPPAQVAT